MSVPIDRSIRRLLGESLGYPWAETGLTSPLCASSRGMHMGVGPACRPDCWPLTRNPFLEASWNKVQRHHWRLKYSFISICLTYQKIYQHFHSFTHSFIPSLQYSEKDFLCFFQNAQQIRGVQFNYIFLEWVGRSLNLHPELPFPF